MTSKRNEPSKQEETFYLIDLAIYVEMDPPIHLRGFINGRFSGDDVNRMAEIWAMIHLKRRAIWEKQAVCKFMIRPRLSNFATNISRVGLENVVAFCEPYSDRKENAADALIRTGMQGFEMQMQEYDPEK